MPEPYPKVIVTLHGALDEKAPVQSPNDESAAIPQPENNKIVEIITIGVDHVVTDVLGDLQSIGDSTKDNDKESIDEVRDAEDEFWAWPCRYHNIAPEIGADKVIPHSTAIDPLLKALEPHVRWSPTAYFTLFAFFVKMAINLSTICLNFRSQSVLMEIPDYAASVTPTSAFDNSRIPTMLVSTIEFLIIFPLLGTAMWAAYNLYMGRGGRTPEDKLGQFVGIFVFAVFTLSQISLLQAIVVFNYLNRPFNILLNIPNAVSMRLSAHKKGTEASYVKDGLSYTVLYVIFVVMLVASALFVAVVLVIVCSLAAMSLYVKLLQIYPLIKQDNLFAEAFRIDQSTEMRAATENIFRFVALCINIAGLYQEPSRVHFWSSHRIKDTWLMGRLYNRGTATVLLYHLNVTHWVAKRAFWLTVKNNDLIVCAPEGFDTRDSFLND
ncbi:hypothetical protein BC938DRAFT_470957 [Jimgerdemannia flammicorona]|uniref:Uncharacterized protein n=1 Tax=Jimgerdemannia flammicorona TaxID=994334 RepID=A0A433QUX1_9FUNG|nr:hypothetical protein BC938DRAFT_470957 [Jimgerdemannia flammicorona]